jgi:hypothetical protein
VPLAALLVLALLLAQALGSMHRVAHAGGPHALAGEHAGHSLTAELFSGHDGAADCRLYDQLAQSEAAPPAAGQPAAAPPGALPGRAPKALPSSSAPADCRVRGPPRD